MSETTDSDGRGGRTQPFDNRSEDLRLAGDVARDAQRYLATLHAVAYGAAGAQSVALLLLDVAQVCVAAAHLSARTDVVLDDNPGPGDTEPPDVDALREGLASALDSADAYAEVFDPYDAGELVRMRLSDDLADIAVDLLTGLAHYEAGRSAEALWWWQYTCLNSWGMSAGAALRALQSLVAHARLDAGRELLPADVPD